MANHMNELVLTNETAFVALRLGTLARHAKVGGVSGLRRIIVNLGYDDIDFTAKSLAVSRISPSKGGKRSMSISGERDELSDRQNPSKIFCQDSVTAQGFKGQNQVL